MEEERQGEAKNLGPNVTEAAGQAHDPEKEVRQEVVIRHFNTTHLDKNGHILLAQDCDIVGVVEHKLSKEQSTCWMGRFRDALWNFMPSPADERGKTPLAGVGIGSRNHITQINHPIKTECCKQMNEAGRISKCLLDVGWESNIRIYVGYVQAGGSKAARNTTEAMVDAARGEMQGEETLPTFFMADFNATPSSIEAVREMIDDDLWEDIGEKADWWGGNPNEPTCKQRAGGRATRFDGILANMWALPLIKDFKVCEDEQIPTHSVLQLTLAANHAQKGRDYVKTLPSVKKLFDDHTATKYEGKEAKEVIDIIKNEK